MIRRIALGAAVLAAILAGAGCSSKEGIDDAKAAPAAKSAWVGSGIGSAVTRFQAIRTTKKSAPMAAPATSLRMAVLLSTGPIGPQADALERRLQAAPGALAPSRALRQHRASCPSP